MPNEKNNSRLLDMLQWGIGLVLFILPFFWFAHGVVDLGGDSSRAYYMDPMAYLSHFAMSAILNIGHIVDFPGYYGVSFTLLLIVLSRVFAPNMIDAILTGISLSGGFLFTSLVARELLRTVTKRDDDAIRVSSLCAGLLYVFIPYQTKSWTTPLMTQFAYFLNPAFLYYVLRYLTTGNLAYLGIFSLISYMFTQNFSFAGAPFLFSFYPITVVYLALFARGRFPSRRIWGVLVSLFVMMFLHGFHWFSLLQNMFMKNSALNTMVFDVGNIKERGLSYFFASASSTYLPYSLLGAPQFAPIPTSAYLFAIFPLLMTLAGFFVWKMRGQERFQKFYIGQLFLFAILLLLVSGHILPGFETLYSYLFYIPGFTMFRAFYDKWAYPYYLYYSIFIGMSYYVLYHVGGKTARKILMLSLCIPVLAAIPFIRGTTVITPMFGSKTFHSGITFDRDFQNSLNYIKDVGNEDRWLNLPFADWEYQVIRDRANGIYIAPSIISLLRGKTDYVGLVQFEPYKRILLSSIKSGDYGKLNKLLEMLSVRYVFFNKDQSILSSYHGNFPYNEIGSVLPQTISEYENVLGHLNATTSASFGFYDIRHMNNNAYPRVYTPDCVIRTDSTDVLLPFETPLCSSAKRATIINTKDEHLLSRFVMHVYAPEDSYRLTSKNVINADIQYSFAKFAPNSIIYPFIRMKEQFDIWQLSLRKKMGEVRAKQYAFAAKRIYELDRWRSTIPPESSRKCATPRIFCQYTGLSWTDLLDEYRDLVSNNVILAERVGLTKEDADSELLAYITRDEDRVKNFILTSGFDESTRKRLLTYATTMFESIRPVILQPQSGTGSIVRYDGLTFKQDRSVNYFVDGPRGQYEWTPLQKERIRGTSAYEIPRATDNLLENSMYDQPIASISGMGNVIKQTPQNTLSWVVLSGIQGERYYRLSLSYTTEGQPYDIVVNHYNPLLPELNRRNTILRQSLYAPELTDSEFLFKTDKNALGVEVRISPSDMGKSGTLAIRSAALTELSLPKILETQDQSLTGTSPDVRFTKINPTKYEVHITNATQPFYLVLNDSYSDHWSIFERKLPETAIVRFLSRTFGKVYGFIDPLPVEFLYNRKIDTVHVKVNYFANGWLIDPKTLENGTGTLVIEHGVQGYFYLTFAVSVIVAGMLALVLGIYGMVRIYRAGHHE